jgi:hypothetical protein
MPKAPSYPAQGKSPAAARALGVAKTTKFPASTQSPLQVPGQTKMPKQSASSSTPSFPKSLGQQKPPQAKALGATRTPMFARSPTQKMPQVGSPTAPGIAAAVASRTVSGKVGKFGGVATRPAPKPPTSDRGAGKPAPVQQARSGNFGAATGQARNPSAGAGISNQVGKNVTGKGGGVASRPAPKPPTSSAGQGKPAPVPSMLGALGTKTTVTKQLQSYTGPKQTAGPTSQMSPTRGTGPASSTGGDVRPMKNKMNPGGAISG